MRKRGETSAGNVATLISLIALFLIVYLLLLPQADRDKILGTDTSQIGKEKIAEGTGEVLLSEFVGKVKPGDEAEKATHDIASVNLFSKEESDFVTLSENLIVSKGFFSSNTQSLFFRLEPDNLLKAELFLVVDSGNGELVVRVNGNEFYRNEITSGQFIIEIPKDYLSNLNNIELDVEGFGVRSYDIRDIKLRKKEEIKNRVARRTFSVNAEEKSGMNRAVMRYSVFCDKDERDSLSMLLNDKTIYTDVPFCNLGEDIIELSPNHFKAGLNTLDFETEGNYVIEGIHIKTFSGKEALDEYFFSLDQEEFIRVRRGLSDVVASFEFSLKDDRKNFIFEINGEEINIDTTKDTELIVLNDFIEEENLIRIIPKNSFEILEFKVVME